MMAAPVLKIADLAIRIEGNAIVDGVSLSIAPGQVVALVGESGCGKRIILANRLKHNPNLN